MKNIFVIFRLCFVGSLFTFGAVVVRAACDPPPAGIVSWWHAEGNAIDQVGGINGTLVGNTGYTNGEVGQAFNFDGNGDGVQVSSATNLQLQDFTIETWIMR